MGRSGEGGDRISAGVIRDPVSRQVITELRCKQGGGTSRNSTESSAGTGDRADTYLASSLGLFLSEAPSRHLSRRGSQQPCWHHLSPPRSHEDQEQTLETG